MGIYFEVNIKNERNIEMSTKRLKNIIVAVLSITMLLLSSMFLATAVVQSPVTTNDWFSVNGTGFTGYLTSMPNSSSIVTSSSFRASNGTGVDVSVSASKTENQAFGNVVSLKVYGNDLKLSTTPLVVMKHTWSNSGNNFISNSYNFGHPTYN